MEDPIISLATAFLNCMGSVVPAVTVYLNEKQRIQAEKRKEDQQWSNIKELILGMSDSVNQDYKEAAKHFNRIIFHSTDWQVNYLIGVGLSRGCWDSSVDDKTKIEYQSNAIDAYDRALSDKKITDLIKAEVLIRKGESKKVLLCAKMKDDSSFKCTSAEKRKTIADIKEGIQLSKDGGFGDLVQFGLFELGCSFALFNNYNKAQSTYDELFENEGGTESNDHVWSERMIERIKKRYNPDMELDTHKLKE